MCDNDSFDDMVAYRLRQELLSRRTFGSLTLGAGLASLVPLGCAPAEPATSPASAASGSAAASTGTPAGGAPAITESEVTITTPEGTCDAYFVHPTAGASPAVLVWPDIFGLRPAFRQMGKRLAASGYAVLVVNPFYRKQKAPTAPPHPDFEDKATREALMALMHSLSSETAAMDAKAFTAWLDQQPSVDKARKIGTTGYCMGGPLVMRTAAAKGPRMGKSIDFGSGKWPWGIDRIAST
jgi:carboxymethylenebutenolidase